MDREYASFTQYKRSSFYGINAGHLHHSMDHMDSLKHGDPRRKEPNPMELVLTAQNLSCRYKEAFSSQSVSNSKCRRTEPKLNAAAGQWQLIIKIAGVRRRKAKRSAWAYEAKNLQGVIMFCGVASSTAISTYGAVQEALVEAAIKARSHGYHRILFLSNSRNLVQSHQQEEEPRLAREDYGC